MVKTKNYFMYRFLLIFIILMFCFLPNSPIVSLTVADGYTNVLEDLKKDESFKESDYVLNENDFSIHVIQIAETTGDELLIYTYQPSGKVKDFKASSVNISTGINDNLSYKNYDLTFLNSEGVFYKYCVEFFEVKKDALRYYDISSIFRPWDETIDEKPDDDNTISEVAYVVSKLFTASTVENQVTYTCVTSETIEIVNKHVGFIRYFGGFELFGLASCDSHYVAFSTDKPIEKLMEADVYFVSKKFLYNESIFGKNTTYEDPISEYVNLTSEDIAENITNGIFGRHYSWNRIEDVKSFVEKEDLTSETKASLKDMQWVLRFKETSVKETVPVGTNANYYLKGTAVENVTILRLKFETFGVVYNLGVVDNKQSGDLNPDNNLYSWLKNLIIAIVTFLIILMIVVMFGPGILVFVFKLIVKAIGYVFKGVWWLITAPFSVFDDE